VGHEELNEILKSGSFPIEVEESLHAFVSHRLSSAEINFEVFEFIELEYLRVSVMQDFGAFGEVH
jgi:hypothetical protein